MQIDPSSQLVEPPRTAQWLLVSLVCAGIVFNNLLRWYPFPVGRSANDLSTLDTNLFGIIVNVFLYCAILAVIVSSRPPQFHQYRSRPLQLYCLYLALQAPFRADPVMEAVRSWAMIVMLLSADWMAAVAIGSPRHAERFLRSIWWTMLATVGVGMVIGVVLPDSVNWGNDLSPSFIEKHRAEFFFFHVLPHFAFALSLAVVISATQRRGLRFLVALGAAVLIPVLAERTMTRTITFSVLLIILVFLFRYARRTLLVAVAVIVLATVSWPAARASVAYQLRLSDFASSTRTADEAMSGRLLLVRTDLQSFRDSPIFGQGAVEARRRVWASESLAKTEHGYFLHLASSGLFSCLLFAYVLQGLVAGIKIVLHREGASNAPARGPYGIAIAAVAMASFGTGFFWTFSSATAFYEWFAIFFVSAARITWQMTEPARSIPTGA